MPKPISDRSLSVLAWVAPLLLFVLVLAHTVALRHLLTFVVLVAFTVHCWRGRYGDWPIAAPACAWLAFALLSCLWSASPALSANAWLDEAFYPLLLFFAFHRLGASGTSAVPIVLSVYAGIFALGLLSVGGYSGVARDTALPDLRYYYPGVGQASSFAVLALPVFFLSLSSRKRWWIVLGLAGVLTSLGVGAVSLNKMFWLTAALMVPFYAFAIGARAFRRYALLLTIGAGVAILVVLASIHQMRASSPEDGVHPPARPPSVEQLEDLVASDARPTLWRTWSARALEHPWLGVGFGKQVPHSYHGPRHSDDPVLSDPYTGAHAHNLFLNTVLQTGVVGLLLFVWLLAALAWQFLAAWKHRPLAAWAGMALIAVMIAKNTTDDFMRDSMAMYFWALAGWLVARATMSGGSTAESRDVHDRAADQATAPQSIRFDDNRCRQRSVRLACPP